MSSSPEREFEDGLRSAARAIGVAPPEFRGTTVLTGDLWVPINMVGELSPRGSVSLLKGREFVWLVMGARLKPGVSVRQASAELENIGRALEQEFPAENRGKGLRVVASSPIPGNGAPVAAFLAENWAGSLSGSRKPTPPPLASTGARGWASRFRSAWWN